MADVTKAEWQALTDRLARVEKLLEKMEPNMWFVTAARTACVVLGALILAQAFALVYSVGWTSAEVKNQAARLDRLETAVTAEQKERAADNAHLLEVNSHLLEVLLGRVKVGVLIHDGQVVKVAGDELTIHTTGADAQDVVFKLTPDTKITIDGKEAGPADLHAGVKVQVLADDAHRALSVTSPLPKP